MNFKTNLTRLALLSGSNIKIYFENKVVELCPPSLKLYLTDLDFLEFLSLLKQKPVDFNKNIALTGYSVETSYDVLQLLIKLEYKTSELLTYFKIIFPNSDFRDGVFYFNDQELTNEEYDIILEILLLTCAEGDLNLFLSKLETKEEPVVKKLSVIEKKMKENADKMASMKKVDEKTKNSNSTITIDQIVIGILYEFPSLRLEDIFSMNMVTLLDFWKYVSKVVDNQIQIVAAGNGLTKEFTYFIN